MRKALYPLKFAPILKETIWGGSKLRTQLGKAEASDTTGESWEISGIKDNESILINGELKGRTLNNLLDEYKEALVGKELYAKYGNNFPLLIKFIDAQADLSVQVHPDDEFAKAKHNGTGKTEMWYICEADINAQLIAGFSADTSSEEMTAKLSEAKLEELLKYETVKADDSFYIPARTLHAIGKGILLAEIQQSSDITYRLYDYNRKDAQGNTRQLHLSDAMEVLNYSASKSCRIDYTDEPTSTLVESEFFTTNIVKIKDLEYRDYSELDSFVIFLCLEGSLEVITEGNEKMRIIKGETFLLPASIDVVGLAAEGEAKLLEVYI